MIHTANELVTTDISVTPAATMAVIFAVIITALRPYASNNIPDKILERPLHTAKIPTRLVAKSAPAPTDTAKSRAKLITELPTAVMKVNSIKPRQKVKRLQAKSGLSNYRIYTDLKLNPGNLNAWLKHGNCDKVSLETARQTLRYMEHMAN